MKMKLVDSTVRSLKVAKVYRDNTARITSIHFAPNGEHLIAAAADDYIIVYDCQSGTQHHALKSKKFGVGQIRYLHGGSSTVIHSSTKLADDSIRYLSLHDNRYLRYFAGHTKAVVSLDASPADDVFMSTSLDRTLRLWDLRRPQCTGIMQLPESGGGAAGTVAAIDPDGLVFATGRSAEGVRLYDMRAYEKGPFQTVKLSKERAGCEWTGMKFARDGKMIVLSTSGLVVRMVDAFQGTPLQTFQGHHNSTGIPLEASFTPDSKFLFSGSTDGRVHCWDTDSGFSVCKLNGGHPGPTQCVQFNPKYVMLASACTSLALWLPALEELQ